MRELADDNFVYPLAFGKGKCPAREATRTLVQSAAEAFDLASFALGFATRTLDLATIK